MKTDTNSINFMTWNATGIMTGIPYLDKELKARSIDICGISEHWLRPENSYLLNTFNKDYTSHVVVNKDIRTLNSRRIGKGGVAFLWKNDLSSQIEVIDTDDDRLAMIKVILPETSLFFIQVYLPTSSYSLDYFIERVDKIFDLYNMHCCDEHVVIMGDFNARITNDTRNMNTRDQYLLNAINLYNFRIMTNTNSCRGPRFTFTPYGPGSNTFIDHVVVSELLYSEVNSCCVLEDAPLNVSRHFPIVLSLNITRTFTNYHTHQCYQRSIFNWKIDSEIECYRESVTENLQNSQINFSDPNEAYDTIVKSLNSAAEGYISKRTFCKHLKPYWSAELKEIHKDMRKARAVWVNEGKPRYDTDSRKQYKDIKRSFRRLLRKKYSDYEKEENDRIDHLAEVDQKGFWKAVNARKSRARAGQGSEIKFDSTTLRDPDKIVDGWKNYFTELYSKCENPDFDEAFKAEVDQFVESKVNDNDSLSSYLPILTQTLTKDELETVMKLLPYQKSPSYDNITYEHVVYGGDYLKNCLLQLYQRILETGKIPDKCKDGLIITLHKGRGKSLTDPNNYRAISLLPAIYKIFEKILQMRIENSIIPTQIHQHQHGFQKGKSCSMVTFILQECAHYCIERGSELYACFMDAEKAFDRVWLNGLLYKLFNMGIKNMNDFRLLYDMFSGMKSRVLSHNLLSDRIAIQQGTRQGSLLSPFMYSVFLHDLHIELDNSGAGIRIGGKLFTAPTQADDLLLLSLTKKRRGDTYLRMLEI